MASSILASPAQLTAFAQAVYQSEEMKDRGQRQGGLLLPADTWADLQKVAASTGTQGALESAAMVPD